MSINAKRLKIESPLTLAAVAVELEARAAERFSRLSDAAEKEGRGDLKALFLRLRHEEEVHGEKILRTIVRDAQLPEVAPSLLADLGLKGTAGGADFLPSGLYQALASAVRSEEKAFAFFSSVAAYATSDTVRDLAEALATEELEHAALLRRVRRSVYHRDRSKEKRWPSSIEIENIAAFLAQACDAETQFLCALLPWNGVDPALQFVTDLTKGALDLREKSIRPLPKNTLTGTRNPTKLEILRAALNEAQCAFDYYDNIATRCEHSDVLKEAQSLSEMALDRITTLCGAIATTSSAPDE